MAANPASCKIKLSPSYCKHMSFDNRQVHLGSEQEILHPAKTSYNEKLFY